MLKLDYCEQLKSTPDFTGAQSLQEISFVRCLNLANVHPSIGSLERLVWLNLWRCKKLKVLPSSICKLKSLEKLELSGCKNLRELPIDIGKLEQLRRLYAAETGISHLPISLGCLRNLESLEVGDTGNSVAVDFFPSSAVNLCSLEWLRVSFIKSQQVNLPIALGSLTSLIQLVLSRIWFLESLSLDLGHLSNLKWLFLEDLQNLRALLNLPPSLERLIAKDCESLEKIVDISNLRRLEWLRIPNCKSLVELPRLESLESLRCVEITNCSGLRIPPVENWFQACSEGNTVQISLNVGRGYVCCIIPRLLGHTPINIINSGFDGNEEFDGVGVSVRSKTTGAWIVKEPQKYIKFELYEEIEFEVGTRIGEVLEVYAHFHPLQKKMLLCLFEIHRNEDGEVRFFPSKRGLVELKLMMEQQKMKLD
ncbi:PREDICTED: disease resistance protein TAO1-like [Ipomoea nil]|uniref:disease resistance protein TAO1-like n=1 Tax=Ipomoea nil TaxID=35883 RepID=UPI000901AC5D|nr:PREDICTED: disease resistance protein TAO1-like [Ipomoea nil]